MKIINHRFEKARNKYASDSWYATVEHEGLKFEVIINKVPSVSNLNGYYLGYIKNTKVIAKKFKCEYIRFGFSDYNEIRYIFEAMIRVIKGDYSEIVGYGRCTATPNK